MRICFVLKIRAEKVEEYKHRHALVWPEMLDALRDSGWYNYSLFLQQDGLVVGYLETLDFEKAQSAINHHPVNARWQSEMSAYFEPGHDGTTASKLVPLAEVFHLD